MASTSIAAYMVAQTFTIDPFAVKSAAQVNITSVDLYFRAKPYAVGNQSGTLDPGVNVYIVPTTIDGIPNFGSTLDNFIFCRKEFSEIVSSRDASIATKFTFPTPVAVKTGIAYSIIFKPDHQESFDLWASTKGEISVTTNASSPGIAGKFVGNYYELSTDSTTWQPLPYKSLKFHVNVARYAYDGVIPQDYVPEFSLYMRNYEFVTYNQTKSIGRFFAGERVYQDKRDSNGLPIYDGTCSVIRGNNTITSTASGGFSGLFSPSGDDSFIVIRTNDRQDVLKVISVSNGDNTITVDKPVSFTNSGAGFIRTCVAKAYISRNGKFINDNDSFIVLSDSSANSTVNFSNNSTLIGEISGTSISNAYFNDILVHNSEPHVFVYTPPQTTYSAKQIFDYTSDNNLSGILSSGEISFDINMYSPINLDTNKPISLMSRSNEVRLRGWSSKVDSLASRLDFKIITTNDYTTPQIDYNATDVYFTRYNINNDYTDEHTNFGNAYSKHITTKVNFAENRQAEDIVIYMQAYKPAYTDFKVYVKFYNSEDPEYFDDKEWTLMRETSGSRQSSLTNLSDYVEYTYGLYDFVQDPSYNILSTSSGTIRLTSGNNTVTGVGTDFLNQFVPGDLVKIYPSIFTDKYIVTSIYTIDSATSLVLHDPISSADVTRLGSYGLKMDKIKMKHQAFNNRSNNNTLRYYNGNMTVFDKYDSFAIKVIFLSTNQFIIPKISNIRAVGVSA